MDDDPRIALEARLAQIEPADLPALAAAWSPAYSDELAAAHLVLAEHERGDLSHVLGTVLDRIPRLTALLTENELLTGEALAEAEHALEVLEGVVIEAHAADLIPASRRMRLGGAWRQFDLSGERRSTDCATEQSAPRPREPATRSESVDDDPGSPGLSTFTDGS